MASNNHVGPERSRNVASADQRADVHPMSIFTIANQNGFYVFGWRQADNCARLDGVVEGNEVAKIANRRPP